MRTAESFPGILAGQLSRDTAYIDEVFLKALQPNTRTIATWLSSLGYETIATITNPQLSVTRNFDAGFDRFRNLESDVASTLAANQPGTDDDQSGPPLAGLLTEFRTMLQRFDAAPLNPMVPAYVAYREVQRRTEWPTVAAADVVSAFLEDTATASEPYFGWCHLMDLHAPLHPDRVNEGGLLSAAARTQYRWDSQRVRGNHEPMYGEMYDSALRYVDAQIGSLIEGLKRRNEWEETLLVVTGDHGEALYDRGVYGHGEGEGQFDHVAPDEVRHHYMYEDVLRVPLLVHGPSVSPGRTDEPVSLCRLGDVFADHANLPDPTYYPDTDPSEVVADAITEHGHTLAVRTEDWKLITSFVDDEAEMSAETSRAYKIEGDRGERIPVDDPPDHLVATAADLVTDPAALSEVGGQVGEETKQRLVDLGYR